MSLAQLRDASLVSLLRVREYQSRLLATVLTAAVVAYIGWKIVQSPDQALQFAFNGLAVGAVYALLAMGFTIVYSTSGSSTCTTAAPRRLAPTASSTSGRTMSWAVSTPLTVGP